MASKIAKLVYYSYNSNSKWMEIKNAEESNDCAVGQKACHDTECVTLGQTKISIIEDSKVNKKNILWAQAGNFSATYERFLEFVLEQCKNGHPISTEKT
jgi:hypothetical protein